MTVHCPERHDLDFCANCWASLALLALSHTHGYPLKKMEVEFADGWRMRYE
jgi:hypothetical protein